MNKTVLIGLLVTFLVGTLYYQESQLYLRSNEDLTKYIVNDGNWITWNLENKDLDNSDVEWVANYLSEGGLSSYTAHVQGLTLLFNNNIKITNFAPITPALKKVYNSYFITLGLNFDNCGVQDVNASLDGLYFTSTITHLTLSFANQNVSSLSNLNSAISSWSGIGKSKYKNVSLNLNNTNVSGQDLANYFQALIKLNVGGQYSYNFGNNAQGNTKAFQDAFLKFLPQTTYADMELNFSNFNVDYEFLQGISDAYQAFVSKGRTVNGEIDVTQNDLNPTSVMHIFEPITQAEGDRFKVIV